VAGREEEDGRERLGEGKEGIGGVEGKERGGKGDNDWDGRGIAP